MRYPLLVLLTCSLALCGCKQGSNDAAKPAPTAPPKTNAAPDKVKITDLVVGKGPRVAETGDTVWMLYAGTLPNGKVFDSNTDPAKDPFAFTIGSGQVIKGWDQGIAGMKIGGKRRLHIPASLAYGANGNGGIPPNTDLNFDVQLLGLVKMGEESVIDTHDDKIGTGPAAKDGNKVSIRYIGKLLNGKVFDDHTKGAPYEFKLGAQETLPAIETGVRGMKVGGVRTIIAPPMTAFAHKPGAKVPPNSEVVFQVTLVAIK